jgi:hypothetical protein
MATTSQHLTWIELEMHGWQREGPRGSRALYDEAHTILLARRSEDNLIYDESTGDFPFFETQAGTYLYTCPDNVWVVDSVLVDANISLGYGLNWNEDADWSAEKKWVGGKEYQRILNVRSNQCTYGDAASLMFFGGMDPGASTQTFRRMAYARPRRITSDAVQHQMPLGAEDYLMQATCKLIDSIDDHEKMESARAYIEGTLKPLVMRRLGMGEQGIPRVNRKRAF